MAYLEPSEYVSFGLSADTADAWIAAASAMIDAHCKRSSLLSTSYTERLRVAHGSRSVQLTYGPLLALTAAQGRYARPRRQLWDSELLELAAVFSLPGTWVSVDTSLMPLDAASGEVTLPCSLFGLPFSEVEVTYTAGWAAVPAPVQIACAQIVKNAQATPGLNVKSSKLDTVQTQYFSDALLDRQVRALLRPYVAERLGR